MTPVQFQFWRTRVGLTRIEAAKALGCSREAVRLWEVGSNPIPRYIALACAAIAHKLKPEGTR